MAILDFFSGIFQGGIVTIILKLVLAVVGIFGVFFLGSWLKGLAEKYYADLTKKDAAKVQADLPGQTKKIFDDAATSEADIEKLIAQKQAAADALAATNAAIAKAQKGTNS